MKAKEFRSKKYGDQRHLFSDQDQEFIDQMIEEYASQPAVSEGMSALQYLFLHTNATEYDNEHSELRESYKCIATIMEDYAQSLNVQGDAQQRYEKAMIYAYGKDWEEWINTNDSIALQIAAGLKEGGQG